MMERSMVVDIAVYLSAFMLLIALMLAFFRLVRGPDIPNKIVALDTVSIIMIGIVCGYSVYVDEAAFLVITVVLALVVFLGTTAVAHYLERCLR